MFPELFGLLLLFSIADANLHGALISVKFDSTVGIQLDDIPVAKGFRDRVVQHIQADYSIEDLWLSLAKKQISMMAYRMIFRRYFFPDRHALMVPPEEKWVLTFNPAGPKRITIDSHDYLAINYSFYSVLVTNSESVKVSEPSLEEIGGIWRGNWTLPADPQHLFHKTKYACMDEAFFPKNSVYNGNSFFFYNDFCQPEPEHKYDAYLKRCHWTDFPKVSCIEAVKSEIGSVKVTVEWQRLEYKNETADLWRFETQNSDTPDLIGLPDQLINLASVTYQYFSNDSCAYQENCIKETGWRRLLRFTASQKNMGKTNLHLGNVSDPVFEENNIFEYHSCHDHYHFKHYSSYQFGTQPGFKTGFCLFSTWRYNNNEDTPIHTDYDTCVYQGIAPGWGDDYIAGLDCQYIDVTDIPAGSYKLSEQINPDGFLCEGKPKLTPTGDLKFVPTPFKSDSGQPVNRVDCDFSEKYDQNNLASVTLQLNDKSTNVTVPCDIPSPMKDCGFTIFGSELRECQPGSLVNLTFKLTGNFDPFVVRVCESSRKLNVSTGCEYNFALANGVIDESTVNQNSIGFKCPEGRDEIETGGIYSILISPMLGVASVTNVTIGESRLNMTS